MRYAFGPSAWHESSGVRWRRPRMTSVARWIASRSITSAILVVHQNAPVEGAGPAADPTRRPRRRPRTQPADGLLPSLPGDPAVDLGHAPRNRGVRGGVRGVARRADPGRGSGQPARVRRLLPPLRDAGERLRVPRSEPVPVVPVPAGVPRRSRDRRPGSSGAVGRALPARPRAACAAHRGNAR